MYQWMAERNGLTVCAEVDVNGVEHKLREMEQQLAAAHAGGTPLRLHAIPVEAALPHYFIDINPGETYLWLHRVRDSVNIYNGERRTEDCSLLGKVDASGNQNVLLIYPDGQPFEFTSQDAALAHQR